MQRSNPTCCSISYSAMPAEDKGNMQEAREVTNCDTSSKKGNMPEA